MDKITDVETMLGITTGVKRGDEAIWERYGFLPTRENPLPAAENTLVAVIKVLWLKHPNLKRPSGLVDSPIAEVRANHGRWIIRCPFCSSAQIASSSDHRFFCVDCLNATVGGSFVRTKWPTNKKAIERKLLTKPDKTQRNWIAGG